jgi:hypothetical protein
MQLYLNVLAVELLIVTPQECGVAATAAALPSTDSDRFNLSKAMRRNAAYGFSQFVADIHCTVSKHTSSEHPPTG